MRNWVKRAALMIGTAAIEPLIGFPIYSSIPTGTPHMEHVTLWLALVAVCCFLGSLFSLLTAQMLRGVLVTAIAVLAVGLSFGVWGSGRMALLSVVAYAVAAGRGAWQEERGIRSLQYWMLAWLYAFYQIFLWLHNPHHLRSMNRAEDAILWSGMLCIFLALIVGNISTLQAESISRPQSANVPKSVRNMNGVLLGVVLSFIAILSFFKVIVTAFQWLLVNMYLALLWFLEKLSPKIPVHQEPGPTPKTELISQMDGKPSLFWRILEKLLIFCVYLLIAAGAAALLILIVRQGYRLVRQMLNYLSNRVSAGSGDGDGYVDEWSSTRMKPERPFQANSWRHRRSSLTEPAWDSMTEREKIRFLYRLLLKRWVREGRHVDPAWTPKEAAEKAEHGQEEPHSVRRFTKIYETVRYGAQIPEATESELWRQEIQKNK